MMFIKVFRESPSSMAFIDKLTELLKCSDQITVKSLRNPETGKPESTRIEIETDQPEAFLHCASMFMDEITMADWYGQVDIQRQIDTGVY